MSKELIERGLFFLYAIMRQEAIRVNVLRNADSISFFDVNLPLYFARNSKEETERRCIWGLRRLSDELKRVVAGFEYTDRELTTILKGCITGGNNDRHS